MSHKACPGCGGVYEADIVSKLGTACPHCGHPLTMAQVVQGGHDEHTAKRVQEITGEPTPIFKPHPVTGLPMAVAHGAALPKEG